MPSTELHRKTSDTGWKTGEGRRNRSRSYIESSQILTEGIRVFGDPFGGNVRQGSQLLWEIRISLQFGLRLQLFLLMSGVPLPQLPAPNARRQMPDARHPQAQLVIGRRSLNKVFFSCQNLS